MNKKVDHTNSLAVIGLSCRFPGAKNHHEFWQNLVSGTESITHFTQEELLASGISKTLLDNPQYVKARGVIPDADCFDADFFSFSSQEAKILDPQIRLFLEHARNALEDAGYFSEETGGRIGVFAGQSQIHSYLNEYLLPNDSLRKLLGDYYIYLHNSNDFLATTVSYKLNLTGPSYTVQTACSTSLVAISEACQHLLDYQCDMAIAGGVALQFPLISGYLYQEGMILSPDGHCRAFDEKAKGTVPGNGVGVVILKRYQEAIEANDHIYAIVKGFATNNDGNKKVGYSAPSVQGQTAVIEEALAMAQCAPHSISYIETHGTGTPQGDPIEIEALKQVFSADTTTSKTCPLGSVKTNIGHCDVASGIAGFIKTVLALYYQQLPPTLHFQTLNPRIHLENSPFFVNNTLLTWPSHSFPRRAGVSSFGIGGTNAHIVLEEMNATYSSKENNPAESALFVFSAKDETALKQVKEDLAQYLLETPDIQLSDAAYTTQVGRESFKYRSFFVAKNHNDRTTELNQMRQASDNVYVAEETTPHINTETLSINTEAMPLKALGELWAKGAKVDWESFNQNKTHQRLSLPTYPYRRKPYIAEQPVLKPNFETYYYEPDWQWSPLISTHEEEKKAVLIFHDTAKQSELLNPSLEKQSHILIHVYQQDSFQKIRQNLYGINKNNLADYSQLIASIWQENKIDAVIFCLSLENNISKTQGIPNDFLAAFFLLKALNQLNSSKKITFSFLSRHMWKVYAQDIIDPFKSMFMGISKTAFYEAPQIITKIIDVDSLECDTVDNIAHDLLLPSHEYIAYRNNQRFSLTYKQILLSNESQETSLLKENGTYVFTGGLGGVSLSIAESFTNLKSINLVLIHRSNFPNQAEWDTWLKTHGQDDAISQKIQILKTIQAKDSHILLLQADVTDELQMRNALATIKKQFTVITGVIHTAGSADGKLLSLQTPENLANVMAAKVTGSLVLYDILKTEKIDFLLLCSALTAITGSMGQLGYCSANQFMDSFAKAFNYQPMRIISINWDQWKNVGMALNLSQLAQKLNNPSLLNEAGLDKAQQLTALWKALSHSGSQLIVSNEPLEERTKKYKQIAKQYFTHSFQPTSGSSSVSTQSEILDEIINSFKLYLGNEAISEHTDFFDCGGDSLLAVQLAHTLEKNCQLKINPHDIQLYPTPRTLSQHLSKQLSQATLTSVSSALIPLQLGDPQRILFLVHPVGGTFYVYRQLIHGLPKALTIYGIQAEDLTTSSSTSVLSIEQIASNYVSVIKNIQPKAPYYLGGFSFGGVVAYEMARQLSDENHKVDKVIMIDSPHQKTLPRAFKDNADIIAYLLHLGSNYKVDPEEVRQLDEDEQIKLFLRHADKLERELPTIEKNVLQRFFALFKTNSEAMTNYYPLPYNGKSDILFFKALEKDSVNPPHPEAGWKELLEDKIIIYDVTGNHLTMMDEPNVAKIANILSSYFIDIN